MILTPTQKELLENIQAKLVRGDIGKIADSVGRSREFVSRVLSTATDLYNAEIVAEAVRIIELREQDTKKLLKKVTAKTAA
ncbi:MAG: hypothetical protein QM791_04330 [Ferruginibacter sp.]